MDRPWPAVLLISGTTIAFIAIFFLPYRDEEIEYDKKLAEEERSKKSEKDKEEKEEWAERKKKHANFVWIHVNI